MGGGRSIAESSTPFHDGEYYTTKEVCGALKVKEWTLNHWVRKGVLRRQRLPGGSFRFFGKFLNEDLQRAQSEEFADAAQEREEKIPMDGTA